MYTLSRIEMVGALGARDPQDTGPLARLHVVELAVAGGAEVIMAHNMRGLARANCISRHRGSWLRALIAED